MLWKLNVICYLSLVSWLSEDNNRETSRGRLNRMLDVEKCSHIYACMQVVFKDIYESACPRKTKKKLQYCQTLTLS